MPNKNKLMTNNFDTIDNLPKYMATLVKKFVVVDLKLDLTSIEIKNITPYKFTFTILDDVLPVISLKRIILSKVIPHPLIKNIWLHGNEITIIWEQYQ